MSKLVLSADQIYVLAYIMKANYLDYYYISLANQNFDNKVWFNETTNQLVSKGVLIEDFSGNISIDPENEKLLKPIFFGTKESSLVISIFGDEEDNIGYRLHFSDGRIILTKEIEGGFEISAVTNEEIKEYVSTILNDSYSAISAKNDKELDINKVSRVFIVKNAEVKVKNFTKTMVESDGIVYEEDTENNTYSLSKTDFEDKVLRILTEV